MKDIISRYNPKDEEQGIYTKWEKEGLFHAEPSSSNLPFTIVIPPPNITGILHMGHALNNTLQDILIRWKRMQGRCSLWVPGTDHAGIATQNVVEKRIAKDGKKRNDLGREDFLKEVWKWREQYGNTIINQLKRLGSSCDWERTRFTMDDDYSEAVIEAFVSLWKKGLIYRGRYIINWCPRCQTALSDEEAPHRDVEGKLYYIRYPFKNRMKGDGGWTKDDGVVVATTRPETMVGDTAVAVNPKDTRYKKIIGQTLVLPLINREIQIIADTMVDKEFGTGAVKVTPAHDRNDYQLGLLHKLGFIIVLHPNAKMNENAGPYNGKDRFSARESILKNLKEKGLFEKEEPHKYAVGHCYRCDTVIEPYLSWQWFVRMAPLAKPAIDAVKKGKIKFYPKRWTKVYLNWMENIRDWCISRQIWWGHRIPVYYCKDCMETGNLKSIPDLIGDKSQKLKVKDGIIVSKLKPERCPECGGRDIYQDEDVLDTWFSSWLWPFAAFGWPEGRETRDEGRKTRDERRETNSSIVRLSDLDYFYPTSVLVTAPEILFFWVARMIMAGLEFMGEIPFSDVYIHGTVRDLTGKKMSKSLGNIIDPIDVIDEFGADALRYSMIAITSEGQDVHLSKDKFAIGRNFANKLWNASRFVMMNVKESESQRVRESEIEKLSLADKWILSRLSHTIADVTKYLEKFRFNEAETKIYDFFWHDFCDWYVEMVKPDIVESQRVRESKSQSVLLYVLESSLKLLHPFMPFITEAIWQNIRVRKSIMLEVWPETDKYLIDKGIEQDMEIVKDIIIGIRNVRSSMDIPHSKNLIAYIVPLKNQLLASLEEAIGYIKRLARLEELVIDRYMTRPRHCASIILEEGNVFIPLEGVIDIEVEKARLDKKMDELERQFRFNEKKLKDRNFIDKAPKDVVDMEMERGIKLKEQIKRLKETTRDL